MPFSPNAEFLSWLDMAGIAVFAASGALAAARARQTLITFCFFALITGTGGGTVRDLLIGVPVFWMHSTWPIALCLAVAAAIWMTPQRWWPERALEWFDAVGLAAYAAYGAGKAISAGIPPLPAAMMGVITACMGGIVRDIVAGVPSIIMRPELYVTAATLSAGLFVVLKLFGLTDMSAAAIATAAGFALRGAAILRGLALPSYRG
jgi:uncharacterized membrane protein YeiH